MDWWNWSNKLRYNKHNKTLYSNYLSSFLFFILYDNIVGQLYFEAVPTLHLLIY